MNAAGRRITDEELAIACEGVRALGRDFKRIYADPPWHHKSWSPKGQTHRSPSRHYQTMSLSEICALPVAEVGARNCHLFLWTTWPHMKQSFSVMDAWGFDYSSDFLIWVKLRKKWKPSLFGLYPEDFHRGMGLTSRKNTEVLLLGRRGNPKKLTRNEFELLFAPRREHSRKPDEAREGIDRYCDGPGLEMFARTSPPGWTAWGDQMDRFAA